MTEKEREREALAQIKEIVAKLGPESYIGAAFDGCFEIAESNIDDDFLCSMKQKCDLAIDEVKTLTQRIASLNKRIGWQDEALADASENAEKKDRIISAKQREIEHLKESNEKIWGKYQEAKAERDAMRMEIITLKAKLYDIMAEKEA